MQPFHCGRDNTLNIPHYAFLSMPLGDDAQRAAPVDDHAMPSSSCSWLYW